MKRNRKPKRQRRSGAAVVEFALVLPLVVLLAFGSIDVGQLIHISQLVSDASREGVRTAIRHDVTNTSDVQATVDDYMTALGVPSSAITVAITDGNGGAISGSDLGNVPSGDPVSVEVTVVFDSSRWISFLPFLDGTESTATTIMRRD